MRKIINNFTLNARQDVLSGLTVALALVPEAVAFARRPGWYAMIVEIGVSMLKSSKSSSCCSRSADEI